MSDSLGVFAVDLIARNASFISGWDKAQRAAKEHGEAIRRQVAEIGQVVGAGMAAAGTAVAALVNKAINTGATFDDMSQKLGVTAEWLSVMKREAQMGGVQLDALQGGMIKLNKAALAAVNGGAAQAAQFRAIGVAVTDANGKLRSSDQLLQDVAAKMASYRDSSGKAALATEFFGKTGADLIPMLNALGTKGFAKAREEAEALGLIMTSDAAAASGQFQDNLDDLKAAAEGFGVQIVNRVIGPLNDYSAKLVESAKAGHEYSGSADTVANAIKGVVVGAVLVKNAVEIATNAITAMYDTTKAVFLAIGDAAVVWGESVRKQMSAVFSLDYSGAIQAGKEGRAILSQIMASTGDDIKRAWSNAGAGISDAVDDVSAAMDLFNSATTKAGEGAAAAGNQAGGAAEPWRDYEAAQKAAATTADKAAAAQRKVADAMGQARAAMSPAAEITERFAKAQRDAAAEAEQLRKEGVAEAQVQDFLAAKLKLATAERDKATAALKKQGDVLGAYQEKLKVDQKLLGMTERQKAVAQAVNEATAAWNANRAAGVENAQTLDQLQQAVAASEGAFYDQARAMEAAQAQAQRYGDIVRGAMESAIDATAEWAVNGFKNAKDYWRSIVDIAKRAIAQMIAEWAKTRFMRWAGGASGGGGFWSSLISMGAAAIGGGASGGGGSGDAANQTVGGFMQQYQAASGGGGAGGGGGYNPMSMLINQGGKWVLGNTGAGAWLSSNAGAVGTVGAWGGALAGAYYGYNQGDGGIGTAGSTAAGAIAGYYAGTVAAGALLGASGAAAAGGAVTAGAASGAMGAASAVPIVGWIAALALIVDKVTGGAIFGSKYRPNELHEKINFSEEGVSAKAILNEWKYVSQGSQFLGRIFTGGALLPSDWKDMKFRNREIPVDPEMLKALQKVFDALGKTAKAAAAKLQTDVVSMVDAAFETVTYYDRKGKVERTETVGTILGKQYKEEWEKFQTRMHAELLIATLAQLDTNASAIAEAYRANAETLMDAAQTMVQAQADLQAGMGLLGGGDSLKSVMAWLENQRQGDEQLAQTYARLSQATAQYREILTQADEALQKLKNTGTPVDQMRAALAEIQRTMAANIKALNDAAIAAGIAGAAETDLAKLRELAAAQIDKINTDFFAGITSQIEQLSSGGTPAADFALAMRQIWKQMQDNIVQANMLAQAAGKQGASEQQLARIHELAARQAAAAIAKLEDLARQQARNLGYLGPQSVAEIDARIAELQGRADAAAEAVQNFGGAMVSAAQDAASAISLLLGNLSPLNDQAKLAVAMRGLYAGSASREQVLEIGRRLYASSAAYTALFEQVMRVRPRGQQSGGGGGGGQQQPTSKPLTPDEVQELLNLRRERPEQLRRERLAEAQGFAATLAATAAAQGITFQQVADKIGFSLSSLAADMGLTQDELMTYLAGIDVDNTSVQDSFTSNTDRIIAAMNELWGGARGIDRAGYFDSGQDRTAVAVEGLRADGRERRFGEERSARDLIASQARLEQAIYRLLDTVAAGDNAPRGTRLMTPRQG